MNSLGLPKRSKRHSKLTAKESFETSSGLQRLRDFMRGIANLPKAEVSQIKGAGPAPSTRKENYPDKNYECIRCEKQFQVYHDPEAPQTRRQHDVERNVECPYCGKTNTITYPANGFVRV